VRTTVTLDADVDALLRKLARDRGISFKEALNEAVHAGVSGSRAAKQKPFRQKTFRMGFRPEFRWDKALARADAMEDEELLPPRP
jgi:hypothetical protein